MIQYGTVGREKKQAKSNSSVKEAGNIERRNHLDGLSRVGVKNISGFVLDEVAIDEVYLDRDRSSLLCLSRGPRTTFRNLRCSS